jgi:hypothetical protein
MIALMDKPRHKQESGGLSYLYPFYYKAPFSKPYTASAPVGSVHLRRLFQSRG